MVAEKEEGDTLNEDDVLWLILRTFKWDILAAVVNYFIDIIFRLAFSVLFLYLLEAV